MNTEIPKEMVGFALNCTHISLYNIANVKPQHRVEFDRLQHFQNWYLLCLENNHAFSFEIVAAKGWASRHSIALFKEEFASQECRKALQIWAIGDKKMQALLKKLDLEVTM